MTQSSSIYFTALNTSLVLTKRLILKKIIFIKINENIQVEYKNAILYITHKKGIDFIINLFIFDTKFLIH